MVFYLIIAKSTSPLLTVFSSIFRFILQLNRLQSNFVQLLTFFQHLDRWNHSSWRNHSGKSLFLFAFMLLCFRVFRFLCVWRCCLSLNRDGWNSTTFTSLRFKLRRRQKRILRRLVLIFSYLITQSSVLSLPNLILKCLLKVCI